VDCGWNRRFQRILSNMDCRGVVALCNGDVHVLCEVGTELLRYLHEWQASRVNNIIRAIPNCGEATSKRRETLA
jgi:hypothetical protein